MGSMVYKVYFTNALLGAINFTSILLAATVFMIILGKFITASREPQKV